MGKHAAVRSQRTGKGWAADPTFTHVLRDSKVLFGQPQRGGGEGMCCMVTSWQQKLCVVWRKMAQWQSLFAVGSRQNAPLRSGGQELGERRAGQGLQAGHRGRNMGRCLPNTSHGVRGPTLCTLPIHHSGLKGSQYIILCLTRDPAYWTEKHSVERFWFLQEARGPEWGYIEISLHSFHLKSF